MSKAKLGLMKLPGRSGKQGAGEGSFVGAGTSPTEWLPSARGEGGALGARFDGELTWAPVGRAPNLLGWPVGTSGSAEGCREFGTAALARTRLTP
jgi:hypothetical protein